MTLFEQWKDLIENQTEETFRDFWEEYSGAETKSTVTSWTSRKKK